MEKTKVDNIGEHCGNCRFNRMTPGADKTLMSVCHRFPPQIQAVVVGMHPANGPQWTVTAHKPIVNTQEWCGEWKPKTESIQ